MCFQQWNAGTATCDHKIKVILNSGLVFFPSQVKQRTDSTESQVSILVCNWSFGPDLE